MNEYKVYYHTPWGLYSKHGEPFEAKETGRFKFINHSMFIEVEFLFKKLPFPWLFMKPKVFSVNAWIHESNVRINSYSPIYNCKE